MTESREALEADLARVQSNIDAHEKQRSRPLEELLAKLYDSERHCTITWMWDGGVDVVLDYLHTDRNMRHVAHPSDLAAAIEEMMNE